MSDELAAFFAKKASKGKKKGVKLAEVADQLERRAKIQDELDENEVKTSEEAILKPRNTNNHIDNEDSEWLEFNEKPSLPSAIKEMEDLDIESEEEEKRSSVEPVKTWNMNNESSETTPPPAPQNQKEVKYVPKAVAKATRNPLDISNEMLFPTLGNAAEVEKELKKEEEENIRIQLEEKRKREEIEAAKPKRYNAPRGHDGDSPRKQQERRQQPDLTGPTESETMDNWRNFERTTQPPKESYVHVPEDASPRRQPERRPQAPAEQNEADVVQTWRTDKPQPTTEEISYRPRNQEGENTHKQPDRRQQPSQAEQNEADVAQTWRSMDKPQPPAEEINRSRGQEGESPRKHPDRRQQPSQASDNDNSWRTISKEAKADVSTKVDVPPPPIMPEETNKARTEKKAYVPPHLRAQNK